MPNPKKKRSRTKRRTRRTHQRIIAARLVPCARCKALKISHAVCPHCGTYAGRSVIAVEE